MQALDPQFRDILTKEDAQILRAAANILFSQGNRFRDLARKSLLYLPNTDDRYKELPISLAMTAAAFDMASRHVDIALTYAIVYAEQEALQGATGNDA